MKGNGVAGPLGSGDRRRPRARAHRARRGLGLGSLNVSAARKEPIGCLNVPCARFRVAWCLVNLIVRLVCRRLEA